MVTISFVIICVLLILSLDIVYSKTQFKSTLSSSTSVLKSDKKQHLSALNAKHFDNEIKPIASKHQPITLVNKLFTGYQLPNIVKLIFGVGGIYGAFLYYGTLQEDVFHYSALDGTHFKAAWFLQTLGN